MDGFVKSCRLVKQTSMKNSFSMTPDDDGVLRHLTVAQAFFKYGNETMVKRLTNGKVAFRLLEKKDLVKVFHVLSSIFQRTNLNPNNLKMKSIATLKNFRSNSFSGRGGRR